MRLVLLSLTIFLVLSGQAVQAQTPAAPNLLQKLADLPAPAPFDPAEKTSEAKERPADFMDEENVPPDDAPIEDLLDYWAQSYANLFPTTYRPTASKKTIERILDHCEDNPEKLSRYLGIFPPNPDIAETIKKIYDKQIEKTNMAPNYEFSRVQEWLKFNSRYHLDELLKSANEIRDENNYVQNANQHVLRALAKVDWDAALPIVQRLENDASNPYSAILAKWVSYQHARDTGDFATENAYRHDLQKIVENTGATWARRDLAMDALVIEGDYEGRDEWYMSLLEDETLLKIQDNGYTGLTTLINLSPRKKFMERMIELSESSNATVRSAAARNLVRMYKEGKPEALKALVPWLLNKSWAKESRNGERAALIKAFGETLVPESVPGLIAIVMGEEDNRSAAALALVKYKDPRAIPALRSILATRESPEERNTYIGALVASGGFSDEELMADLEGYAALISTPEGQEWLDSYQNYYGGEGEHSGEEEEGEETAQEIKPIPLNISIGKFLADMEEPPEGLVVRAMARLKILKKANPPVAATLSEIIAKWKGKAIYVELLRRIRSGEADIENIVTVLANRAAIRTSLPGEVSAMRAALGVPRGIGSCIAEEPMEYLAILGSTDMDSQAAMLGCTRLLRAALPVNEVAGLLGSPNKLVATAAMRYLESEDGLEARKLVLARNKGGAVILGARTAFIPDTKSVYGSTGLSELFNSVSGEYFRSGEAPAFQKREDALRKELAGDPALLAVYAILTTGDSDNYVVRLYEDKAVFTYYENKARYWERTLAPKEYEGLYSYLIDNNIDALKPELGGCEHECDPGEFVMFGRDGGRRVYYEAYPSNPKLEKLIEMFTGFREAEVETKLHYRLGDKTPGLEILLADAKFPVRAVWKKGDDLRFVVEDLARGEEIERELSEESAAAYKAVPKEEAASPTIYLDQQQKRLDAQYANFSWRSLENGKPGGAVGQPTEAPFLYDQTQVPAIPNISLTPRAWQVRTPNGEIRLNEYEEPGLVRVTRGHAPVKIIEGAYRDPIVSADGKWAIVTKVDNEESEGYAEPQTLARINLQTRREFPVKLPPADGIRAAAFVYSHNKILIYRGKNQNLDYEAGDEEGEVPVVQPGKINLTPAIPEYYLLDAATGAVQRARGEFRPLEHQTYRPLQPTGVAGEFWAAIYDENTKSTSIGRYSDKTFTFQRALTVPNIEFDSMATWVDEAGGKVYFVYEGHLLSLPLK